MVRRAGPWVKRSTPVLRPTYSSRRTLGRTPSPRVPFTRTLAREYSVECALSMPQGEERRRHPRIRLEGRAVGRATVLAEFRVVFLWDNGGTLELPLPLALGSLCDLTLSLGPGSVDLKARVVQVEAVTEGEPGYRVNVDFLTMDPDDQALLQAFLDREGRSSP
ncbi:MAG: hypothetical protein DMF83_22410 [Acidobacteria bacterium]|nr:MAG: hypothetical protein DMF83_22410 [Acidobacteriota bacterium]